MIFRWVSLNSPSFISLSGNESYRGIVLKLLFQSAIYRNWWNTKKYTVYVYWKLLDITKQSSTYTYKVTPCHEHSCQLIMHKFNNNFQVQTWGLSGVKSPPLVQEVMGSNLARFLNSFLRAVLGTSLLQNFRKRVLRSTYSGCNRQAIILAYNV